MARRITELSAAASNAGTWGPVVNGNVIIIDDEVFMTSREVTRYRRAALASR